MQDILQTFLERPSARNYRTARRAILTDPEYRGDPFRQDLTRLVEAAELCERGEFAEATQRIERMMPEWALSPRLHCYAAYAAEAEGDLEEAELEQFLATSCLQGLLATGDGSRRRPYLVMHISDEHDVLDWLGHRCRSQRMVPSQGHLFDVLTVEDEREFWFEIGESQTAGLPEPSQPVRLARVLRHSLRDFTVGGSPLSDRMLPY